jgi:phosphoribosylanthranilate isomerase
VTRIKVCGFTRPEQARAAADAGADAIGVVFWPRSPRAVSLEQATAIGAALPPFVTLVGVFVNEPGDVVAHVAASVGLGAIQLHGDERVDDWEGFPLPVLKAVGVDAAFDPEATINWPRGIVPLLDAADHSQRGGTGRTIDWAVAARTAGARAVVLAGGLTPENVEAAIVAVGPAAVDVSSGVEQAPGVKDLARIEAFVQAVRRADRGRV